MCPKKGSVLNNVLAIYNYDLDKPLKRFEFIRFLKGNE